MFQIVGRSRGKRVAGNPSGIEDDPTQTTLLQVTKSILQTPNYSELATNNGWVQQTSSPEFVLVKFEHKSNLIRNSGDSIRSDYG